MSNNLVGLNAKLAIALRDAAYATWVSAEDDELVTESVNQLWPRFSRILDPTATTITLVAGTYFYALPAGVMAVSRVDRVQSDGTELGPIHDRSWEIVGSPLLSSAKLHVAPAYADGDPGGTLRLNGYGVYDVTTNLVPDFLVPLVLARARGEAYRREIARRMNFTDWQTRNQAQNVSVTELIHGANDADGEALRLEQRLPRTAQLPVPGRIG